MNRSYEIAESVLQGRMSSQEGLARLQSIRNEETATVELRSATSCLMRLMQSLSSLEQGQRVAMDVASHLRQFILTFRRKVVLGGELIKAIQPVKERFGLVTYADGETDVNSEINGGYPDWIRNSQAIDETYQLKSRKQRVPVLGDGILHHMTGFTHYQSSSQKQLVQAAIQMQSSDTLTICLPTGGGKSLVGLLPAFFDTEGGTLKGGIRESSGTTIVVVPTTGLAIDQMNAASKYFNAVTEEKYLPQAYRSEMPQSEKEILFEGLKEGTVPILFTSPESLVIGPLGQILLESAGRNHVNRLVIDEAHIVIDWGNHFRTGFQLLSAYRKQLLERSRGKLKTILMSATLTPWTSKVLKDLFSEEGKYTEIRCDALRYEPAYLVDRAKSDKDRYQKITHGIGYLPRPLILYVNKKDHAKEWVKRLKDEGYTRVKMFSGDTKDSNRRELLKEWNEDRIDIMVATSAFGMGVDKPDIRTIIHCGIPESLNRYYQEVGRGGRDGFASVSIVCYVQDDVKIVHDLIDGQIITPQLLVDRWSALYEKSKPCERPDELWLDMTVQPEHLKHTISGKPNANWNVASVLLMVRNGLLELVDFERAPEESPFVPYLRVRILVHGLLDDTSSMLPFITPDRERERERITLEVDMMKQYLSHPTDRCLSEYLVETYPYSEVVCGGCAFCQKNYQHLRFNTTRIFFPFRSTAISEAVRIGDVLSPYFIGGYHHLLMTTPMERLQKPDVFPPLLNALIRANVRTIVLPQLNENVIQTMMEKAPDESMKRFYILLQQEELQQPYAKQVRGPVAIVYPPESGPANTFYCWAEALTTRSGETTFIHVVDPELHILSEGRPIRDTVDHLSLTLDDFLAMHRRQTTIALY